MLMERDPVLDGITGVDEAVEAPPGAAMSEGSDTDEEIEELLAVGVASMEMIDETPVGRLMSRVTVTRTVTVWVAVSVTIRYLRARCSK
jgi:hypothetical protein